MKLLLLVIGVFLVSLVGAQAIEIIEPLAQQYDGLPVMLSLNASGLAEVINYSIDGQEMKTGCAACEIFITPLTNLSAGEHTLLALAVVNGVQSEAVVTFSVAGDNGNQTDGNATDGNVTDGNQTDGNQTDGNQTDETMPFTIGVHGLENNSTLNESEAEFFVHSNATLDTITVQVNGGEQQTVCTNCHFNETSLNLSEGNNTIVVTGTKGDQSVSVTLTVMVDDQHVLTLQEMEDLPEQLGTISDEELALIIEHNELPPWTTVELIESGTLGNESQAAIVKYQTSPEGIFKKVLEAFNLLPDEPYVVTVYNTYETSMEVDRLIWMNPATPQQIVDALNVEHGFNMTNETNQTGNETNQTDGNATDGNQTDGNQTDGNQTEGNQSDLSQVSQDINGDGIEDVAMDANGDGIADGLDLNGDGVADGGGTSMAMASSMTSTAMA